MASKPYSDQALAELRRILLAPEYLADALSPVLADLLHEHNAQLTTELVEALRPALRLAVREALRDELRDPSPEVLEGLAEAIEPFVAQGTRKTPALSASALLGRLSLASSGDLAPAARDATVEPPAPSEPEAASHEAASGPQEQRPKRRAARRSIRWDLVALAIAIVAVIVALLYSCSDIKASARLFMERAQTQRTATAAHRDEEQVALLTWFGRLDTQSDDQTAGSSFHAAAPARAANVPAARAAEIVTQEALPATDVPTIAPAASEPSATAPTISTAEAVATVEATVSAVTAAPTPPPDTVTLAATASLEETTAPPSDVTSTVARPDRATATTGMELTSSPSNTLAAQLLSEAMTLMPSDEPTDASSAAVGPEIAPAGDSPEPAKAEAPPPDNAIYLTFDDGPNAYWTPQILDILAQYGAHASFFVIGKEAANQVELVQTVAAAGHLVGHHTWGHTDLVGISHDAFVDEIERTSRALGDAISPYLRPPGGEIDENGFAYADELGLEVVRWNIDPEDWQGRSADEIAWGVISQAQPGGVILLHDGGGDRSQTIAALPVILQTLQEQGYVFLTVAQR